MTIVESWHNLDNWTPYIAFAMLGIEYIDSLAEAVTRG